MRNGLFALDYPHICAGVGRNEQELLFCSDRDLRLLAGMPKRAGAWGGNPVCCGSVTTVSETRDTQTYSHSNLCSEPNPKTEFKDGSQCVGDLCVVILPRWI